MRVDSLLNESSAAPDAARWRWLSYGYALLVAIGVAYFLLDLPIQVTDCYGNMDSDGHGNGHGDRHSYRHQDCHADNH